MRNYLKFLATTMVAALLVCVLCMGASAVTTVFTDVDDSNEVLSESVSLLSNIGVANGTSATTFGTNENVTREQMAAFVYRLFNKGQSNENVSNITRFGDLDDPTYYGYVSWANNLGIIKGTSETTFNPKGGITLQDAYTMLIRGLGHDDGTLSYPFDYIDMAEKSAIALDNGLSSSLDYTSTLTRGDVAVILANAFFAETSTVRIEKYERLIGNGTVWVLEEKPHNLTLAENIYDVEVGEFVVRATPKYAFNDSYDSSVYAPLYDQFDADAIQLVAKDKKEPLQDFFCFFEDSRLSGAADDYVMRTIEVFYTYNEEADEQRTLDKVYFARGDYKVLETNNAAGAYRDAENPDDYYAGASGYEKVEGYVTVGDEKIYFFDAPYSYIKPNYNSIVNKLSGEDLAEAKEILRNEENVKLINIKCLDLEYDTYSYYLDDVAVDTTEDLIVNLQRIYSRGVYKIKFMDMDGNGIYEYAHYKPATYGFMDGNDSDYFSTKMTDNAPVRVSSIGSDYDLEFKPVIYYNGAKITGTSFKEGDLVVAYLNPEANMIEVMGVVKPYRGYVATIRRNHCQVKIDNIMFSGAYSYRVVENFYDGDDSHWDNYHAASYQFKRHEASNAQNYSKLSQQQALHGELVDIYAYKVFGQSNILYYDHIEDAHLEFGPDEIIIPIGNLDSEGGANTTTTKSEFDPDIGDTCYYVKSYIGGKTKYIPLDVKDMFPTIMEDYEDGNYVIGNVKGQGDEMAYVDKLCKFTIDSKGLYTLVPILHAEDEPDVEGAEGAYAGISRDPASIVSKGNNKLYGNDLGYDNRAKINKIAGTRYELVSSVSGETLLGDFIDDGETIKYFNITDTTRIVIRNSTVNSGKEKIEYLEFDNTTFLGSVHENVDLVNVQYVLRGNPNATNRADLVILYAEANDFEFAERSIEDGWRIVASSDISDDEEGLYRNYYTLLNPFTGLVEENVPGDSSSSKIRTLTDAFEAGTVVEIKSSKVDENGKTYGFIDSANDEGGMVLITDFNTDYNYITAVPYEAVDAAIEEEVIKCEKCYKDFIETYTYLGYEENFDGERFVVGLDDDGNELEDEPLYYQITEDTAVTVVTYKEKGTKALTLGEFKLSDISAIADGKNELKSYNEVANRTGNLETKYAKHIKAFVYADDKVHEGEMPEAEFIVVVVDAEEEILFSDYDNFLMKNCEVHADR